MKNAGPKTSMSRKKVGIPKMTDTSAFTIMEEREEAMVSLFGSDPFLRTAHFLKPTNTNPPPLSPLSKAQIFDVKETPLKVHFRATTWPQDKWKDWVYKLLPTYQDIWKKAGIYDAVLNSTYKIIRDSDLILALAERWCVETNTFVFPWGESTITLEDMIVLGGYSVLGDYISTPLSTNLTKEIEEKLIETRKSIVSGKKYFVGHSDWMGHFIDKNNDLEHVAFLALWLARYVFTVGYDGVPTIVFPIAIHLSLGTRLAIAPAVLAILYRNLSLMNKSIISKGASSESENLSIWAPIQMVQIWAWERFLPLRPSPNPIQAGEPRSARWHEQKQTKVDELRTILDSCAEDFQWRPYCMVVNNWKFNDFYRKDRELVSVESGMDEEIESFAICIRPSGLVGLGDFIEQYLPHCVAMQFGYDQDIPGSVPRFNESRESAWGYYKRPVGDKILYIPPRLFESDVTSRYLAWWDPSKMSDSFEDSSPLVLENGAREDVEVMAEPIDSNLNVVKYKKEMNILSEAPNDENETPTGGNQGSPGQDHEARITKLERKLAILKTEYFLGNV